MVDTAYLVECINCHNVCPVDFGIDSIGAFMLFVVLILVNEFSGAPFVLLFGGS